MEKLQNPRKHKAQILERETHRVRQIDRKTVQKLILEQKHFAITSERLAKKKKNLWADRVCF